MFEDCEAESNITHKINYRNSKIRLIPADASQKSIRVEDSTYSGVFQKAQECYRKWTAYFPQKATKCIFCRPTSKYFAAFCGKVLSYLVVPVLIWL